MMSFNTPSSGVAAPAPPSKDEVTDLEPLPNHTNTRSTIRLGFWVLIVGFGLFLAWAAWAPLDEGVIAPSTVSMESRRKTIQHQSGGVVREVTVKEGQEVNQGDVLAVLDDATVRAGFESIRQNYLAQRAVESRLLAELTEAQRITFHPDLLAKGDAVAAQHVSVQQQLFGSRRAAQQAEIGAAKQSVSGLEGQVAGLRQVLENRSTQAALQSRQLANVKSLADDGFAPRNQALQLEQGQAEIRAALSDLESNIQRAISAIAETKLRIAQRKQEFQKEVSGQLAEVRREVQANQERLAAITNELQRMQIRSPVEGQVVGLATSGLGGVVSPGQRLMDIVPRGEALLLEAKVPTNVIDRIKPGDETEVRFSSFANAPQLVVHGKVLTVSKDTVSEQSAMGVQSFYLARIEVTPAGIKALGDHRMQPGMPAEVLIKTGERSLLTYLLHPLLKRVAASMTEE